MRRYYKVVLHGCADSPDEANLMVDVYVTALDAEDAQERAVRWAEDSIESPYRHFPVRADEALEDCRMVVI